MSPELRLASWCSLLALLICYAWWSRFRVWVLRQDLFAIRDDAWDAMRAKGSLDDPAHREFRASINGMIRFAPDLTLFTVWRILVTDSAPESTGAVEVPNEIALARHEASARLARYLLFESIIGLALVATAIIFHMLTQTRRWLLRKVLYIFDSPLLRKVSRSHYGRWATSGL